jgi:hypothetical protein
MVLEYHFLMDLIVYNKDTVARILRSI